MLLQYFRKKRKWSEYLTERFKKEEEKRVHYNRYTLPVPVSLISLQCL